MKNIETPDKMHLGKLIRQLRDGQFIIPDFQRDFKWSPNDVKELLRSIFEDYYIGTLLLWRTSREKQITLSCKPIYGFEEKFGNPDAEHIVLDGQQRLSALFYVFFSPDIKFPNRKTRAFFTVNLEALLAKDFDNVFEYEWLVAKTKKLLGDQEEQFIKKILPLGIIGEESKELYKWLDGYEKHWSVEVGEGVAKKERKKIEDFFDELLSSYDVSYIELDREMPISKVCDIFTKINSTGINLTIFDLLNALLRPKEIKLKEMWTNVMSHFEGFDLKNFNVQLLQTMSILEQGYCAPKYLYYLVPGSIKTIKRDDGTKKDIQLISSDEAFIEKWDFVVDQTKKTMKMLSNHRDFGAIQFKFVPYPTMLPILTALNIEKEKKEYSDKKAIGDKIKKWYWASIFTKNYSSSVESQMARDFKEMKSWFKDDNMGPRVIKQFEHEIHNISLKQENTASSAVYKAIFDLLIIKGAKDWDTFVLPEYSVLDDHHIVPRSWGKKNGLDKDKSIDTILNRTPLSDETNRVVISDTLPNVYLPKMFSKVKNDSEVYTLLGSHFISKKAIDILVRKDFSEDDYREFIEERQKTIVDEIKKLFGVVDEPESAIISPETPFSNKLQMERTIKECAGYIYWIDKYFSKAGLDILAKSLDSLKEPNVKEIKILTSIDRADLNLRNAFKDFKKEFENKDIEVALRVIVDSQMKSKIHDRWIVSEGKCFNLPSTDTIARGQYSEINETKNKPPFEEWWDRGLDIIADWNKVEELKSRK